MRWALLVGCVATSIVYAAPPQTAESTPPVVQFLDALDGALSRADRQQAAALLHYPVTVNISGLAVPVPDREAFFTYFDSIITPSVTDAVRAARTEARAGRLISPRLRVGDDGLMVGAGVVRARLVDGRYRVVGLTVPSLSRGWQAARAGVLPIQLRRPGPTKLSGALARGERETYAVWSLRGQLLTIRLDGVAGRDVVARVVDATTGTALDARADAGARAWSGRPRRDGHVHIVVARHGGTDPALAYVLSVDVR